MAFKYRKAKDTEIKQDAVQQGGNFARLFTEDVIEFTPKKGTSYTIRVCPPTWGDDDNPPSSYAHELWANFGIGPDGEGFASRSKLGHDDDPVVEMHDRMRQHGDEYAAVLKEQKAKKRRPMYVIVRGEEDKGIQAWAAPWTVQRDIAKASVSKRKGTVKHIDDPWDGYDVLFSRATNQYGDYDIDEVDEESSPMLPNKKQLDEALAWLTANPLPTKYKLYPYEEINRKCLGDMPPEHPGDEDFVIADEEPEPDRPRTRSAARKQANSEPEHDAADGDDGEPEPEPEPESEARPTIDDADEDLDEVPMPAPKKRAGVRRRARAEG